MKKPIPFGKYYLLERINVGGMAEVYRAKAYGVEGFERLVAVKRILPNVAEDKEFIKMFVDEAKISVQLTHANIAQIFDLGMVGSDYYIALEHIHGRDTRAIFERCREDGEAMPIAQACFCVMKVCEGLDYAHNKRDASGHELGLVHRDVSPQNILVSFDGEVKLIDFGIAKAAGRGSQTEAGILKGKFGYMSPEQVRGLPIDRRSDVFACGIVLYELLTGERLFVGESDFSTLEKVRNVEILPPSTYNRRIPDELERIVLKALAKDVEDRYQNAIDLHDELQAFVYTAGEFYSRKDLAGWMKRTFAKEIEAEQARLEEMRQFNPNAEPSQPPTPRASGRATMPPPLPPAARRTGGRATVPPPIPSAARRSTEMPAASLPSLTTPPAMQMGAAQKRLDWDEDELETSIYDGPGQPEMSTAKDSSQHSAAAGAFETAAPTGPHQRDQDLAGLVQKARDWNEPRELLPPVKTATGSGPKIAVTADLPVEAEAQGSEILPVQGAAARAARGTGSPPIYDQAQAMAHAHTGMDSSAVAALAAMAERQRSTFEAPTMDLMDRPMAEGRLGMMAAIGGGVLLLIGGIVAVVLVLGGDEAKPAEVAKGPEAAAALSPDILKDTGFDLVVRPSGVAAEVRLDGKPLGTAPLKIRNLVPGEHQVEIVAPAGFYNQVQKVNVEEGRAPRMTFHLDGVPLDIGIESEPSGATAVLIAPDGTRKDLGPTPVSTRIDIHKSFQLELSLDGYATSTQVLELTADNTAVRSTLEPLDGAGGRGTGRMSRDSSSSERRPAREEQATAALEAAAPAAERRSAPERAPAPAREAAPEPKPEPKVEPKEEPRETKIATNVGKGTLMLGSKPPCDIYIDGKKTGMKTPQRSIDLAEGMYKVVLVNNEFGIKDAFKVEIVAGKPTKVVRDLTDKMQ